ncbi:glycoside hydrolase family 35 protein [Stakelama pacifica]|uniref:Beta-galactosidase n=1 Tax=Stakelama pacifica TaxID=517720 RepID=A0A4V3BT76_9SPHN|nr:beta-galactosidase family protein [Stakelama pacifica]TDN82338.1 beta-galactosidase [Stakelama pacifica]GGO95593.1 beta-galactosidase [Stakelama pacifica]
MRFVICYSLALGAIALAGIAPADAAQGASAGTHSFVQSGHGFLLDGKPYQVISGEMHYVRIPREYWRDRLRKAKAMGLNTITTYAFWNVHEPKPGVYDFSGQHDIAAFIRAAQAEGLNVILRPGPYVCAEWELGGYPAWLLKDRKLVLRSRDPDYTAAVDRWMMRLGKEVKPLMLANGGPIVAVQLENEYGAFGDDKQYLKDLEATYRRAGLADGVLLTSNQPQDLAKGSLPGIPATVNFGSGNAQKAVTALEAFRPDGLRMVGEYWAGWFDKWGEEHHETDGRKEAEELRFLLKRGYSVSLYMVHGGTTFGWMNGADSHTGTDYHPDTTSYDYDAPIDEAGNPRYKYGLIAAAIADATGKQVAPVPAATKARTFAVSPIRRSASLWNNLPEPVRAERPMTFEELGQNYGYVLYRTALTRGPAATLKLAGMHSYAQVYIDQKLIGTLDRRLGQESIKLPARTAPATLDILVENTGRVNYSHAIRTEQTGLTGGATLDGAAATDWRMYRLPMDDVSTMKLTDAPCTAPCFYEAEMTVDTPVDSWIDMRGLHKGQFWMGDHNLGRFWSIGPVHTLYAPAPWMHAGINRLRFFDLQGDGSERLTTVDAPIYGAVTNIRDAQ